MKKRIWVVVIATIIVIAVSAVGYKMYSEKNFNDNYIYTITYDDDFIPGARYTFYINEDYNVKAIREAFCTAQECMDSGNTSRKESYIVNISNINKGIFKEFVQDLFKDGKTEVVLSSVDVEDNVEQIINVLKYDNELFFRYYEK